MTVKASRPRGGRDCERQYAVARTCYPFRDGNELYLESADVMRTEITGKKFSLIKGAVRGTLEIYREGPENDLVFDLEIDLFLPGGFSAACQSPSCAPAPCAPEG